ANTPIGCGSDALQAIRLKIYQHGAVKDIRVVDHNGAVRCSAYSETLEFDRTWATRDEMLPARDQPMRLFRVDQFFGIALGLMQDVDATTSVVGIIPINESLFDIMPTELRYHSKVSLELSGGQSIALYPPTTRATASPTINTMLEFSKSSESFPVHVEINVDARAYAYWNRDAYVPIIALGIALGLAFGALLAHAFIRPRSP